MFATVNASQMTKIAIFAAIGFTVALIVLSQSGENEAMAGQEHKVGGLGSLREKDDEVSSIVERIKPELIEKSDTQFDSLEVLGYKHQVVAGINYFVKAKGKVAGGGEKIVHLRIYKNIQNKLELTAFDLEKQETDELKYFQ